MGYARSMYLRWMRPVPPPSHTIQNKNSRTDPRCRRRSKNTWRKRLRFARWRRPARKPSRGRCAAGAGSPRASCSRCGPPLEAPRPTQRPRPRRWLSRCVEGCLAPWRPPRREGRPQLGPRRRSPPQHLCWGGGLMILPDRVCITCSITNYRETPPAIYDDEEKDREEE